MPIPTTIAELSQTAGSNSPAGSDSPTTADDFFRAHASFLAYLRDFKQFSLEATIASAATVNIGGASSYGVNVTGTTTITSFGTDFQGPRFVRFAGALVLTHNATTLILPGGANIAVAAGDSLIAVPQSGGWKVVSFTRASGVPLNIAPAFSAYAGSTPSIDSGTFTKVALNTEEYDTAGAFDSSTNYRFTPLVAGYYQVSGCVTFGVAVPLLVTIYKNGSRFKDGTTSGTAVLPAASVSALVYFNGSTDYVELFVRQSSGGALASSSGANATYFQGALVRPA